MAVGPDSRKLRAVVLIALSLGIAGVAGTIYSAPQLKPSAQNVAVPTPTPLETAQGQRATYDFLTPSLGWAVIQSQGANYVWIFRTDDGAKIWTRTAVIRIQTVDLVQAFQFFDRTNGYLVVGGFVAVTAVAAQADFHVYRTQDGGANWKVGQAPDPQVASYTMTDPLHGWATFTDVSATRLFATSDGGESWSRLPDLPAGRIPIFRGAAEGWMSGDSSAGPPAVYSSADGGLTWTPHVVPQPLAGMSGAGLPPAAGGFVGLTGVTLLPGSGVLVNVEQPCSSKQTCSETGPLVYTSFDEGTTWHPVTTPPGADFAGITYQDGHHWWVMQNNSLWKTADAGQSWQLVSDRVIYDHLLPTIIDGSRAWVQILLTDDSHAGHSLSAWELEVTTDGGVKWNQVSVPVAG